MGYIICKYYNESDKHKISYFISDYTNGRNGWVRIFTIPRQYVEFELSIIRSWSNGKPAHVIFKVILSRTATFEQLIYQDGDNPTYDQMKKIRCRTSADGKYNIDIFVEKTDSTKGDNNGYSCMIHNFHALMSNLATNNIYFDAIENHIDSDPNNRCPIVNTTPEGETTIGSFDVVVPRNVINPNASSTSGWNEFSRIFTRLMGYCFMTQNGVGAGLLNNTGFYILVARHKTDHSAYYIGVGYKPSNSDTPIITKLANNKIIFKAANYGGTVTFDYDDGTEVTGLGDNGYTASWLLLGDNVRC